MSLFDFFWSKLQYLKSFQTLTNPIELGCLLKDKVLYILKDKVLPVIIYSIYKNKI